MNNTTTNFKIKKEILESLNDGEDFLARDYLTEKIEKLIIQSGKGEIGLGMFLNELEKINNEGKNFLKVYSKVNL